MYIMVKQIEVLITGIEDETFAYLINPTMTPKELFQDMNSKKFFPKYGKSLDYRKFWLSVDGKCVYDNERFTKVDVKEGSTIRANIRLHYSNPSYLTKSTKSTKSK